MAFRSAQIEKKMFLGLIWLGLYIQSPYLFPSISPVLYLLGMDPSLLLGFPLSFGVTISELRQGKRPSRSDLIILELVRCVWIGVWIVLGVDLSWPQLGYSLGILMRMILHSQECPPEIYMELAFVFYVIWGALLVWIYLYIPLGLLVQLSIHLLNFAVDFRIPLELLRYSRI